MMRCRFQAAWPHFFLALFLSFLFSLPLFAEIKQWDFQNAEDYNFDGQKIEVKDGVAGLISKKPYRDQGTEAFDRGEYSAQIWAARDNVELVPETVYEKKRPGAIVPLGTRQAGIMALWNLDEPSGTNLLDQVGRNIAKASDAEVVSGQPGFGYGRRFDGIKSHIFIPHYQSLNWTGPFTLETWVRPMAAAKNPQTLISKWQAVGSQKGFAVQRSPEGKIDFQVSQDGAIAVHHYGESVLVAGSWYHVVCVFTGEDLRVYVNGVLDGAPTPFRGPLHSASNPIYVGALIDSRLTDFFEGVIDEIVFYDRALGEMETLSHFGNSEALVALWHFNDRAGLLQDDSGYGHFASPEGLPVYHEEGRLGGALSFDGVQSFAESAESYHFGSQDEMTIEGWVKPSLLPGNGQLATLLSSQGDEGKGSYGVYLSGPNGRLRAYSTALHPDEVISQSALMPDIWQHVAVSWGSGTVRLYMNGLLDTESAYQGFHHYGKSGLRFAMDEKKTAPFRGSLDEFAIYRRARTAEEIAASAGLVPSAGTYTSQVKDALEVSPWRSLSWEESLPYGEEISEETVGLLNHYSFNEGESGVIADSKAETPLSAFGTHPVPGIFSGARWFVNKGYDKLVSQKDFPPLSTFSVSLWFQMAAKTPGLNDRLFSIGDESPTVFRGPDGRIHAGLASSKMMTGNKIVADSAWHHLMLSADGRDLMLYVDGVFDGRTPFIGATSKAPLVLGNLKSTDSFQGAIDDFAFFNYSLSEETLRKLYLAGKTELKFLVRSSEKDSFPSAVWRGPAGPSAMELTPSVSTAALWHFNERSALFEEGALKDAGKFANHATAIGHAEPDAGGVLEGAIRLNGASDFLIAENHESLQAVNQLTLSAWVKPSEMASEGAVILDKQINQGPPAFSTFALELVGANRLMLRLGYERGYHTVTTERDGEVAVGRWNHVAAVYDGKQAKLFINGALKKTASFHERLISDSGPLFIGRYGSASARFFGGSLDEILIDARAFSDHEIQDLFHKANPENYYRVPGPHKLDLESDRYFQYRAFFASSYPLTTPSLEWVEIHSSAFAQDGPSISNRTAVSFAQLEHFRERTGASHQGGLSYQISPDGANWYFHNGRRWVIANKSTESNTAAQLEKRLRDFPEEIGIGSFYFKAFLHSLTGLEAAQLDVVEVEYLPNRLTLSIPNGGEAWTIGTDQILEWKSAGDVGKVTLEYSKDNFKKDFHTIKRELPNLGKNTWKIPNDPATQVKVRVSDALDPRIYDTSDISFRITGSFEMISPNWNERWLVGTEQNIRWKWNGRIEHVKLDYSTDNFNEAIFPIVDSVKNEGRFKWKIPDHISSTVKVRVSDVSDELVGDASNDTFAITGSLELLRPKEGERWLVDFEQDIQWQTVGTIPRVKIEYRSGVVEDWKLIAQEAVNQNGFRWKIPDEIDHQTVVRISDPKDTKVVSESRPFSIVGGLHLIHPKGGEKWTASSKRKIAWQTLGTLPNVKIEYALGDLKSDFSYSQLQWKTLEAIVPNIGNYVWEIPEDLSGGLIVRISSPQDAQVEAVHAEPVELIPGFVLNLPKGGENWEIGSEMQIHWRTAGAAENVKLEYSKDNFVKDIHEIIDKASNVGQFNWTVPDDPSTQVKVRISDAFRLEAQDSSDSVFRIHGNFRILTPKGNEKFEVGSLATLEWETLGNISKVKIEYSGDDFTQDIRLMAEAIPNEGRLTWTVPDHLGVGYRIRITDVQDPLTRVISEAQFSIVGDFHLIQPLGGENLTVGTVVPILWKSSGSVPFVRIDYSEDNFEASFNTIAHEAPNHGTFDWTVPNRVGKQFKIRIWDPSDPDSMDLMNAPARITGGFMLRAPNGGEILYPGEPFTLAWESFGMLPRVKLEYSDDNFNQHIWEITDTTENIGRYQWHVPDQVSGLYKIRVSDPKDVTAYDISNADFRIRTRVSVLTPKGYERWALAESHPIRWQTSSSVPEVLLEYSGDDFLSSVVIEKAAPNTGLYDWIIPDYVSQNVKVKVSDAKDAEAFDTSDIPFQILGLLKLISPVGGEVWKVGEQREISWTTNGKIEGVELEYSRDDFTSEAIPIMISLANSGTFQWTVPDDISANIKIRITDAKNPNTFAVSPQPFQIAASFALLAPNGGEVWHAAEKREISWVTVGSVKEVDLFYSSDHFQTDPIVIDRGILNTGNYIWDIPRILGDRFHLRICDSRFEKVCDDSDQIFSIRSPFEIVFPRGGESWPVGSDQEIRWNTHGRVDRVIVEYTPRGKSTTVPTPGVKSIYTPGVGEVRWKILADELANGGQLLFRVPDEISNQVLFRVRDYEDDSLFALSKEFVKFTGTFTLLSPNGGEKWAVGSAQKINWDTLGTAPNVRLEYSDDEFKTSIHLIEAALPNTGVYEWKPPATQGPLMKVRVMDAANPESQDISDASFKIMAGFQWLEPNGGEGWVVGSKHKIRWETFGKADRVVLSFRIVNSTPHPVWPATPAVGESWTVIAEDLRNGGEYEWQIPSVVSGHVRLRIQDMKDSDAQDETDSDFSIRPDVRVIQPDGGESVFVGRPYEIRWDEIGTLGRVRVEYSKDHFEKDIHLISEAEPGIHSVVWTPRDDVTTSSKIRISSIDHPEASDLSDEAFQILPSMKLVSPRGGEKWIVGSEVPLSWDWRGTLDSVKIEYSANDFASAGVIAEKAPGTGSFKWQVPDHIASNVKIRISDSEHPVASIVSEIPFKIIPGFKILSPNGGELWEIGSRQEIQWETVGTSQRIRIEYATASPPGVKSIDTPGGEGIWKSVAQVLRNQGAYQWVVPSDVSSNTKIKIVDALDADALDESDAPFKILAVFKFLSPKADEILFVDDKYQIQWETQGHVPSVKLEYSHSDIFKPLEPLWANTGYYFWSVPDGISEQVRLKISDALEPDAFHVSPIAFKIRGRLKLELPEGKVHWPVGSTQTLSWKTTGSIPRVSLAYCLKDGDPWKTLAQDVVNTGSRGWVIPEETSPTVQLRLEDASNREVFDQSEKPISIAGIFEFVSPQVGDIWKVGENRDIQWKTTGSIRRVHLAYASGKDWISIAGPILNENVFAWKVPDDIGARIKIRVQNTEDEETFALSGDFGIQGGLEWLEPKASELFAVGTQKILKWQTTGSLPWVRLELIHPDTAQSLEIVHELANQENYEWTIPDFIQDGLILKISDIRDPSVFAQTASSFSILGAFDFVSPKSAEIWKVDASREIAWMTRGNVPTVVLEYSRDDFYRDINLITAGRDNTGSFVWETPDAISKDVKIRISDARDSKAFQITPPFEIKGSLLWHTPAGGEVWTVKDHQPLYWQGSGSIPQVRLEYSRDDFKHEIQVIENAVDNKDTYDWVIPDLISKTVKLRLSDVRDPEVFHISSPLEIRGALSLKAPLGGEVFQVLGEAMIAWETTGSVPKIRLEYSSDDFNQDIRRIAASVDNQGLWRWNVPDHLGKNFRVRVSDDTNLAVSDQSPLPFEIRGSLSFREPSSEKAWSVGSKQTLSWNSIGSISNISLEYSKDEFQYDIQPIAENISNTGSFDWLIPDDVSENVRLRIKDVSLPEVFAVSQASLKIIGILEFEAFEEGKVLKVGQPYFIRWNTTGSIPAVRLEYAPSTPGVEEGWKLISGSAPNAGTFEWEVPDDIAPSAKFRVSDLRDSSVSAVSEGTFKIMADFEFLAPLGGERWIAGSDHEIMWRTRGSVPEIKLEFSRDEFKKDTQLIAEHILNGGRLPWSVPDAISDKIRLRINDVRYSEASLISPAAFSIIGQILLTQPSSTPGVKHTGGAGGTVWKVGSEQKILWQTSGTLPQVKIEYSIPGAALGPELFEVIQDKVPNQNEFSWTIPDLSTKDLKIRVSDALHPDVFAVSELPIEVQGFFEWPPAQEEQVWYVGEERTLEWKTTGTIPAIRLEYSTDDFQNDKRILEALLPNSNRFLWTVEDLTHQRVKFRVKDAKNETVFADSAPVRVRGVLEILSPASAQKLKVGEEVPVEFRSVGTIPQVKIEYSKDQFVNDIHLIETQFQAEPGSSTFRWQIPDALSDKVWLRVSDVLDPSGFAISKEPFAIEGDFSVLLPRGGEVWTVGESREIVWRTRGSIPRVTLQYSPDGFLKDIHTLAENIPNQELFSWQVADAISPRVWIRVLDSTNPHVGSAHSEPLQIQGALLLKEITPLPHLTVGSHAEIQWDTIGSIKTVRLEYQPSGISKQVMDDQVIEASLPNQGNYSWQVPDLQTTHVKLKISDGSNPNVFSESRIPISILGTLEFVEPQGAETWAVGSTQQIRWKSKGPLSHVKLEYSRDQFLSDYGVIMPLMENTGSFTWKVPDLLTKNLQIRVVDSEHPEVFSVTAAPIEIRGSLTLSTPQGGEMLEVGAKLDFTWSTEGSIPYIRLDYSKNPSFGIALPIEAQIENTNHYTWLVPDEPGEYWLRISDASDSRVSSMIYRPIQIRPGLLLNSPKGGEIWQVGEEHEIRWQWIGKLPQVRLEYSTDDFQTPYVIQDQITNEGRFKWRIPDTVSDNIKVRVVDTASEEVFSKQAMPLKIQPVIYFLAPREREFWRVGTQHEIRWQTQGSIPAFKLAYSVDRFAATLPIAENLSGVTEYIWTVPDIGAQQIWFRLTSAVDSAVFATSETPIEIGGALQFKEPLGGEVFKVGQEFRIAWETFGTVPKVRLEISGDHFKQDVQEIASNVPNSGEYRWKVPDRIHPSLELRVSDGTYPNIFSDSSPFKVTGNIKWLSPKGGEIWQVGSRQTFRWDWQGSIPYVRIDYSDDGFTTRHEIASRLINSGSLVWEIPDLHGKPIKLRIFDESHEDLYDETEFDIQVFGSLEMIAPQGPVTWTVGSDQTIAWKTKGGISNVHLDYSSDDFLTSVSIAENLANSGAFLWRVPDMKARNLKIRVMDASHTEIFDGTQALVTVQGKLILTSPLGGEVWLVGTKHPITWSSIGPMENIRLEYWTDKSRSLLPVISSVPNKGNYDWIVPDTVSKQVSIRVSDADNAAIVDEMSRPFEIRPVLTLLSPVGGEIWGAGTRHSISWKTQGSVSKVKIEYSPDDFAYDIQTITPSVGNKGIFYWEVPPLSGNKAKVRVSSTADPNVFDISRNAFSVAGELDLIFPTLGETFTVGERVEIRWNSSANIKNVKIEFSADEFETAQLVSDAVPNTGKFLWTVPDKISDNLKLKISDSHQASVFSISKEPLRIKGLLRFLNPRGGEALQAGSPLLIRWETRGTIPSVRLEYSKDHFKSVVPIEPALPNSGSYEWGFTDIIPERFNLRLSDARDPSVQAVLDHDLRTVGQLKIISPRSGERWIVNEEHDIRWESKGALSRVVLEYSKDNFNKDIHLIANQIPNLGRFAWTVPNDRSQEMRVRVRDAQDSEVYAVSEGAFKVDFYRVRWMLRDERTQEHLTGLILSESSGKTQAGLASPVTLEYPYGIFTAAWSKPGYAEFQSSWLVDRDLTLSVMLKPDGKMAERVRANFNYDHDTDVVRVKSWYEKEGKVVAAVIGSEIKIYEGSKLMQILNSSKPDSGGYFSFVWNTSAVAGNTRYLAAVSVSTASGRMMTSPMSYQIDLPVKERKAPPVRTALAPPTKKQEIREEESKEAIEAETPVQESLPSELPKPAAKAQKLALDFELILPDRAALNETVSIQYKGSSTGLPVLDIYDGNKKLVIRGARMEPTSTPGLYTFLLAVKGMAFIPGKSITVSAIETSTGRFKSAAMLIQSAATALGYDQEVAGREITSYLRELDQVMDKIRKSAQIRDGSMPNILKQFEDFLDRFAVVLTEKSLNRPLIEKLNKVAEEFASIASGKGYDMHFLVEKPLSEGAKTEQVHKKFRDLKNAVHMMMGLYSLGAS